MEAVKAERSNRFVYPAALGASTSEVAERPETPREGQVLEEGWLGYVSDIVAVFEPDGVLRYASPAVERVLGYGSEDLVGGMPLGLLHPDDAGRVVEDFNEVWREPGVSLPVEFRVRHADGSWRCLEALCNNLLDEEEVGGVVAVLRDVSGRRRAEKSGARFRAVFEDAAIGMAMVDTEGRLEESNPALQRMLGYSGEELSGMAFSEFTYPGDVTADLELYRDLVAGERDYYQMEKRYVRKDGRLLWGRLTVSLVRGAGSEPRFALGMVEDITDRKRIEQDLRRSEESLSAAQRIARVGNWEYSIDKDEAYWSEEMYRIFGLALGEFVPTYKTFLRFVHPDDKALVRKTVREVLYTGKGPSIDYRVVRPDGEVRSIHTQYEVFRDEAERPVGLVGTVHDITERKALEERLERQAFHDSLTGLPNRALFMDRLAQTLARVERHNKPTAVLFLDLDDFKIVNDSLGHEVGDRLLIEVAGRLSACVRPEDTVARLGGDEFTVLLEDAGGVDQAVRVAERISEALRTPFELGEHRLTTSASIGIVIGGAASEEPGELLRSADLALYEAKSKGKARYEVFEAATNHHFMERLRMERDLRRAIERDEFTVFYQPKMLLEDGGIAGVEALVRWEHPERGLMVPSEFISLAEETGLIVPIGHKVLEEACRQTRAWQERYPNDTPRTVYINLSAGQFEDPELPEKVAKVLRETGVEPSGLALEIAESVLMKDAESAVVRLRTLRSQGVRVVVDDFGTAYSSLSRLRSFPMDFLNIDRSFTLKLGAKPEDTAIMSAMIDLAHALGWGVTAEGVETADQLARLKALGCDMAQGYYLWEPLSSAEISSFLEGPAS